MTMLTFQPSNLNGTSPRLSETKSGLFKIVISSLSSFDMTMLTFQPSNLNRTSPRMSETKSGLFRDSYLLAKLVRYDDANPPTFDLQP